MRYENGRTSYPEDFIIMIRSCNDEGETECNNSMCIGMDDMSPQDVLDCLEELKAGSPHVQNGGDFHYELQEISLPENMHIPAPDMPIERIWHVAQRYQSLMSDIEEEFGLDVAWEIFPVWYSENFVGKNFLEEFSDDILDSFRNSFMGKYASKKDFVTWFFEKYAEEDFSLFRIPSYVSIDYEDTVKNIHQMGYVYTDEDCPGFAYNVNNVTSPCPDTDEDCREAFYTEVDTDDDLPRPSV